jgi:hypothetical protein
MTTKKSFTLLTAALVILCNFGAGECVSAQDTDITTSQVAQNNNPIGLESGAYSKKEVIDRLNKAKQQRQDDTYSRSFAYTIRCGRGFNYSVNTFYGVTSIPSAVNWVNQYCSDPVTIEIL